MKPISEKNFYMPPEWAPHSKTWTAWPHDEELWVGYLSAVRDEFTDFINVLSKFERVELVVADEESARDAKARLSGDIVFHSIPHNDLWLRDSGPTFVKHREFESIAGINWVFNGWGNKYDAILDNNIPCYIKDITGLYLFSPNIVMEGGSLEVNGSGTLLTTKQCLLSPERNKHLSQSEIESVLKSMIGIEKVLWLDEGLEGDHTDGHIDTITRFVDSRTIITALCEDPSDLNFEVTQRNLEKLKSFTDHRGERFHVVTLPLPVNRLELEGERLPATYANFYIANGVVIVPTYDDPNDEKAIEILRPLFPDRKVIGLTAKNLITGGGAFHCVTQQQPAGGLWKETL